MANIEIKIKTEELRKRKLFLAVPMYGGSCYGTFARSINDLTSECQKIGIEMKQFFLFNESLITRARNYCVPGTSIIETENGPMTIKEIIDSDYNGKIKSVNEFGVTEFKQILKKWEREDTEGKTWVTLGSSRPKGKLVCTSDHKVAYVDDPLSFNMRFASANEMVGKYAITQVKKTGDNRSTHNSSYGEAQLQVILGTFLGDGHINKNGVLSMSHGRNQKRYLEHKREILGGSDLTTSLDGFSKKHVCYGVNFRATEQTKFIRTLGYLGNKSPKNILKYVNELALAYWYMDDGHLVNNRQAQLCTQGFNQEDHEIMVEWFKSKFGIDVEIRKSHENRLYFLHFNNENTDRLFSLISSYIHEDLKYKLTDEFKGTLYSLPDFSAREYSLLYVKTVNKTYNRGKLYDIEVESNHNFFADGYLVHNCSDEFLRSDCTHLMFIDSDIGFDPRDVVAMLAMMGDDSEYDIMCGPYPKKTISWEKVKKAVDKGFGDKNPNDLEKYVGDFVFNPKSGTSQIPLHQPVEVLEGGTGFMMIRRSIFEKYQSAYPTQTYRPDHVRSAHFDGSRMVHAFFDCVIDRGYTFDQVREQMAKLVEGGSADEVKAEFAKFMEAEKTASMRYLSEDYMFCQRVIGIGGKVWLCPWMKLSHTGTYNFSGSLMDLAQVGASATADPGELARHKQQQPQQHNQKKKKKR